jgi:hypothetical protein
MLETILVSWIWMAAASWDMGKMIMEGQIKSPIVTGLALCRLDGGIG